MSEITWRNSDARHAAYGRQSDAFPFPLAEPMPEPVMVTRPCGCTYMDIGGGSKPMQVSWCVTHDPGYEPAEEDL